MISYTANARLMKLLPRLAAVTDKHRLKVLSDIDRVLAAEGLTWADVAAALELKLEVAPVASRRTRSRRWLSILGSFPIS
jgi:hypothetical protein